jgi:eukaryotic-like serine/threonine-protein kinase
LLGAGERQVRWAAPKVAKYYFRLIINVVGCAGYSVGDKMNNLFLLDVKRRNALLYFGFVVLLLLSLACTSCAMISLTSKVKPTIPPKPTDTRANNPHVNGAIGDCWVSPEDGMTLMYITNGEFMMGSTVADSDPDIDEQPQHKVYLDAYWMDKTEVTNAMYEKCVLAGKCQEPHNTNSYTRGNYYRNNAFADYAVIYVDWYQAKSYCEWAGRRLPTESEWEKGARGTDGRVYPWGNDAPTSELANYNNYVGDTTEAGHYPRGVSPYGLLDMAGNVWEWVADWFGGDYYTNLPSKNPLGPSSGRFRVLRGGSWSNSDWVLYAADRFRDLPDSRNFSYGFRCVR